MEAHASNLIKVEFASMWLKKHQATKQAQEDKTVIEKRHLSIRKSDITGALAVIKQHEDLEEEEKRMINYK